MSASARIRALGSALSLGLGLVLGATTAAADAGPWGPERLMAELARGDHAQASFVEARYLRLLTRPLTLTGTLSYTPPDRIEKRTLSPNEEILIVDGDRVSVEIKARRIRRSASLRQYPALWGFVESLRATLRGDLQTLQRFFHIELTGDPQRWLLSLVPLDRRMRELIDEIRIGGGDGQVQSVDILETRGDRSVIRIQAASR